jgi:hypothetical protein
MTHSVISFTIQYMVIGELCVNVDAGVNTQYRDVKSHRHITREFEYFIGVQTSGEYHFTQSFWVGRYS